MTFGRGTIRRFSSNVSEMKKLAARDFEDILQVNEALSSINIGTYNQSSVQSQFAMDSSQMRLITES